MWLGRSVPGAGGFRHPVVLYDGVKNFLLVPLLLWVRRRGAPPGRIAAIFVFLYPALRIPIDLLREYPITLWGLPTGQTFNLLMAAGGAAGLAVSLKRKGIRVFRLPAAGPERRAPFWLAASPLPRALRSPSSSRATPRVTSLRSTATAIPGLEYLVLLSQAVDSLVLVSVVSVVFFVLFVV